MTGTVISPGACPCSTHATSSGMNCTLVTRSPSTFLSARTVIEAGDRIRSAEGPRGGQPSRLIRHGPISSMVAKADRLIRPALVDDDLAAVSAKGAEVRVGRVVDPAELLEPLVPRGGERDAAQGVLARRVGPGCHVVEISQTDYRRVSVGGRGGVRGRHDQPVGPGQFGAVGCPPSNRLRAYLSMGPRYSSRTTRISSSARQPA